MRDLVKNDLAVAGEEAVGIWDQTSEILKQLKNPSVGLDIVTSRVRPLSTQLKNLTEALGIDSVPADKLEDLMRRNS